MANSRSHRDLLQLIPNRRVGVPKDVARALVWLASDACDEDTGTTLFVDGGRPLNPDFRGEG